MNTTLYLTNKNVLQISLNELGATLKVYSTKGVYTKGQKPKQIYNLNLDRLKLVLEHLKESNMVKTVL